MCTIEGVLLSIYYYSYCCLIVLYTPPELHHQVAVNIVVNPYYPIPYTLQYALYPTVYPIPYTLYPTPYTLHPIPYSIPIPYTLYPIHTSRAPSSSPPYRSCPFARKEARSTGAPEHRVWSLVIKVEVCR